MQARPTPHVNVTQALLRRTITRPPITASHFDAAGVLVVNLMSSPGSGKTSLLEATIRALAGGRRWR